jgi:hypothetical protein
MNKIANGRLLGKTIAKHESSGVTCIIEVEVMRPDLGTPRGEWLKIMWDEPPKFHRCAALDASDGATINFQESDLYGGHWRLHRDGRDFGRITHCPFCGEELLVADNG